MSSTAVSGFKTRFSTEVLRDLQFFHDSNEFMFSVQYVGFVPVYKIVVYK